MSHFIVTTDAKEYAQGLTRKLSAAVKSPNEEERRATYAEFFEYMQRRLAGCSNEAEGWQELQRMSDDMTIRSDRPLLS